MLSDNDYSQTGVTVVLLSGSRRRDRVVALEQVVGVVGPLETLADSLKARGRSPQPQRALLRLGLDFWTWRRLDREGLDDGEAAELMAAAVVNQRA